MAIMLRVSVPARRNQAASRAARLVDDAGNVYEFSWAPTETTRSTSRSWQSMSRPGRKPLTEAGDPSLETLSIAPTIGSIDGRTSIEPRLKALRALAQSARRVRLRYSSAEDGWWTVTDLSVTVTRRNAQQQAVRATVAITLTEHVAVTKLTGAGPATGNRTYVVKKGDTLFKIARKLLGKGERWREIARLNKIKKPRAELKPGRKLKIPKK